MSRRPLIDRRSFLAAGSAALVMMHPFAARAAAGQAHLRIMETTDIHVNVEPYDYYADRPNDTFGLARTASIIRAIRAEATNSVLVDNGDIIQGNPLGDFVAYERGLKRGDVHPVIRAMNTLGYEASTLGNHEFNYGLEFLSNALAGAAFPFVSANLVNGTTLAADPAKDRTFVPPWRIVERTLRDGAGAERRIRLGFIGFVPPQIMVWDAKNLSGNVQTRDIVAAARAHVPVMREAGADLVVALCHSGIDGSPASDGMENAALHLAGVPGIDVVLSGHQHLVFPGPDFKDVPGADVAKGTLQGKPAVMAGFWGSHLGLVDLLLEEDGGTWRILSHTSEARPIYRRADGKIQALVESQPAVSESVKADHEATLAYVRRPVGTSAAPLHSYFALVADDPSVQIVSIAQTWYVTEMLKGSKWEGLPVLSAAAPFKAGGRGGPDYYTDVPAGPIAIKNVADLYLYPNTVRAVEVTGATVREWLERSAGQFNRIEPGKADQPLVDPTFPSYNFDVIDGVTYRIDLTQPARYDKDGKLVAPDAHRIVDLAHAGRPIDPDARFVVATNNYRAGGGGNFPGVTEKAVIFVGPDTNRDVLVRYIVSVGTINPSADANWSFVPVPGASVVFETGPKGRAYAASVKGVTITEAGDGQNGFARYRIAF
ncbi:bifunctional 2',3'-cyclic-nucleotide 2'-phosphodiesterase/3'-nucleotidase [Prosthecomicrobium sp. N25]